MTALRAAIVVTLAGLITLALGFWLSPAQAIVSYLISYTYVVSLALGLLLFLLITHAMNATWPVATRRLIEHGCAIFPLLLVLFIPIALAPKQLYPWTAPN